jgi:hypothetical protein
MNKTIKILIIILMIIFVIGLGSCALLTLIVGSSASEMSKEENNKDSKVEKAIDDNKKIDLVIQAIKLSEDYEANELKADEKYKGKVAEVTGEVEDISKVFEKTSITLKGKGLLYSINCGFESENEKEVININKGQKITIIGYIDGYGISVDMSKCRIKK